MIGQTIWIYDGNHRVYEKREPGKPYAGGGPIYRMSWRPQKIVGENKVSWITERGVKVRKKAPDGRHGVAMTKQELEDAIFAHDHKHKIVDRINYGTHGKGHVSPATLREIAKLIGYEPPPEPIPEYT